MSEFRESITDYLYQWNSGDEKALSLLIVQVYDELKKVAAGHLQRLVQPQSICPTELLNEVYLRLQSSRKMRYENRSQFFWFAGQLMRRILVEYFRKKRAHKRGSGKKPLRNLDLSDSGSGDKLDPAIILTLDAALVKMNAIDPRMTRIVELKFFAGLKMAEIAEVLNLSDSTVKREWKFAKKWLARALKRDGVLSLSR